MLSMDRKLSYSGKFSWVKFLANFSISIKKVIFASKIFEDWRFLHIPVHTTPTQDFMALFWPTKFAKIFTLENFALYGSLGHVTPTAATSCASRTPILNQVLTGHRKSTRSPQTIPLKPHCIDPQGQNEHKDFAAFPPLFQHKSSSHFMCGQGSTTYPLSHPPHSFIAFPLAVPSAQR